MSELVKPIIFHYAYLLEEKPRENDTSYVQLLAMCGKCFYEPIDGLTFWNSTITDREHKRYCPYCGNKYDWSSWNEEIKEQIRIEEERGNEVTNIDKLWLDMEG